MTAGEVAAALDAGSVLIDTRPIPAFAAGHLPGALNVEFNLADLADRAALLLPAGLTVVVHAEPEGHVAPSEGLLAEAGLRVSGHLQGGLAAWRAARAGPICPLPTLDVAAVRREPGAYLLLDVREPYEYRHTRIAGTVPLPSGQAWRRAGEVPADRPVAVICSGSGRSAFVASLLARHGRDARLVEGGMYQWVRRGWPVVRGA